METRAAFLSENRRKYYQDVYDFLSRKRRTKRKVKVLDAEEMPHDEGQQEAVDKVISGN